MIYRDQDLSGHVFEGEQRNLEIWDCNLAGAKFGMATFSGHGGGTYCLLGPRGKDGEPLCVYRWQGKAHVNWEGETMPLQKLIDRRDETQYAASIAAMAVNMWASKPTCAKNAQVQEAAIDALRRFGAVCPQEALLDEAAKSTAVSGPANAAEGWHGCPEVDARGRYDETDGPCGAERQRECWEKYLAEVAK